MMKATAMEALRRFWWVALLFAVGGAVLGALPEPATTADALVFYRADHVLLVSSENGSIFSDPIATNQLKLYATTGVVPERVAEQLGFSSPGEAVAGASADLDPTTGALTVSVVGNSPADAETRANTIAEVLTLYIAELQDTTREARRAALLTRADDLAEKIDELETEAAAKPNDRVLAAQLDALQRQYSVVFEQQYGDEFASGNSLVLSTLQEAVAYSQEQSSGLSAPKSRASRGALGFVLGGLAGAGVALMLSRIDRRIRSRAQAELLYGGQVSVIVPDVAGAGDGLAVRPDRHDQLSDAYRTLRSMLTFAEAARREDDATPRAAIVLVVSPGSGDGKTSIAANVAASLVETNKRTIAINTDFRRPTLGGRLLGEVPPPLPFTVGELPGVPTRQLLRRTPVPNLVLMDLSGIDAPPGTLARATTSVLNELTTMADAIVIDSSPVGATAEVLELLPYADHVVVAIRLDHTLTSATQRTMQLLRSLSTGTLHLVVVGENIERSPYYEYGNPNGKRTKRRPGR